MIPSGVELAGDVIEIGPGVQNVRVGQRVFGLSFGTGGFAEEVVIPARVRKSDNCEDFLKLLHRHPRY